MQLVSELLRKHFILLLILIIAACLPLPSLYHGLQTDDYLHASVLSSTANASDAMHSLFTFIEPASTHYQLAKTMGTLPWWTSAELKISFWRPFAAFTHWLDYQWWPHNTQLMHLHNIVWYVLLVFVCFHFYKQIIGHNESNAKILLVLSTFIFCIDFSNYANISWLANRNSLICALMCVLALMAHQQWRTKQLTYFLILSQLALLGALAANEAGLIAFLWISAYNLVLEKNSIKAKVIATLPSFILLLSWQLLYKNLGFGFSNSGLYLHPIGDFFIVALAIVEKLPIFIFSQIFGVEGFYNGFAPPVRYLFSAFCFITSGLFLLAVYKTIIHKNLSINRTVIFLALCIVLAFIPASAFALMEIRMSLYAGIPSALLFAYLLTEGFQKFRKRSTQLTQRVLLAAIVMVLIFAHLVLAIAQWSLQWRGFSWNAAEKTTTISYLLKPLIEPNKNYQDKDLIILSTPSAIDYYYLPYVAHYYGLPTPRSINVLALNHAAYTIEVNNQIENENSLVLNSNGLLLNRYQDRSVFSSLGTFSTGYVLHDLNGSFSPITTKQNTLLNENSIGSANFKTTIESTNNKQQITKLSFHFNEKLTSEHYVFLYWENNQYHELSFDNLKNKTYVNKH